MQKTRLPTLTARTAVGPVAQSGRVSALQAGGRGFKSHQVQTMKALSIKQPWANAIASGEKTIETRSWGTPYRGLLLICSSKQPDEHPAGCALALATLWDCRRMTVQDEKAAMCRWYPGAFAWMLREIQPIVPIPVRGFLGVYECPISFDDLVFPERPS